MSIRSVAKQEKSKGMTVLAIGRVLGTLDRSVRRRIGQAARARFEAEFTSDLMNVQTQTDHESVLDATVGQSGPSMAGGAAEPASGAKWRTRQYAAEA